MLICLRFSEVFFRFSSVFVVVRSRAGAHFSLEHPWELRLEEFFTESCLRGRVDGGTFILGQISLKSAHS